MKTLVAFPSTAIFGQQAALAFDERGALDAYLTSYAHDPAGPLARLLQALPGGHGARVLRQLERRGLTALTADKVATRPLLEVLRTAADKAGAGPRIVDRIWDHLSHDFTRAAGRRVGSGTGAVYGYEYSALEMFIAARRRSVATILDFPSLNSRAFEEMSRVQKAAYPELRGPHDAYFDARFERRQARRDAEMHAADVIITNSTVTRASHIAGGADPGKIFAVPYGAPPALNVLPPAPDPAGPLRVVWAGSFSIRKAAHLFVQAWRDTVKGDEALVDIYGAVPLLPAMYTPAPRGMTFHGSVVRPVLFEAFARADVMIFPTLSDGFGMVVTEAFARGLPVITTDQAGASDLVRHGENGLIIPAGHPGAIGQALTWCLENRCQLAEMRQAALQTARDWQWSDYRAALRVGLSRGVNQMEKDSDPGLVWAA